ncbi:hypothetical protein AB0J86_37490 [Micromonospora sp. NPDC049559]|uniref:hypothetical protein n=1 Tax=Micromonospora sp. NPDC049559 TaxID=3155923 RepID=UPI0034127661
MSRELGGALRELAERIPPAAVPEDLFDRARARHRGRLVAAAGAFAVVLLLLAIGYLVRPAPVHVAPAGRPAAPGLPSRLVVPPARTATAGQSPPGAAAMLFGGPALRDGWREGRMAVVAADADRYRVFDEATASPPGFEALLSPDGRYAWWGGELHDLTSGDVRRLGAGGQPLAFAPAGDRIVHATEPTFVDGGHYVTDEVGVSGVDGRRLLRLRVGTAWVPPGNSAAVSPPGDRLALQVRDEVWLAPIGTSDGTGPVGPQARFGLSGGRLAGPGAWLPDGRTLAVLDRSTCVDCPVAGYPRTWRLALRDAATGHPVAGPAFPELRSTTFVQVVGWRSPEVAVALVGVPGPDARDRPDGYDQAWGPYHEPGTAAVRLVLLRRGAAQPEVLFETPPGVSELGVAAGLAVSAPLRPAGRPSYGPPHPYYLAGAGCLLVALAVPAVLLLRRWRQRRRARG